MKKYISYLLTLALLVPAFVSCTEQLEDLRSKNQKTHTVYFSTTDQATKTGLTIEDNMVKPYWQKTDLENIHFFEIDANNAAAPGTADAINLSDDNRTAHFTAAISDDITIIVSPTDGDNGSKGAKSAGVSPFTFAAVVAQMPDKDAYTFVIPSEQHPDAETLKDPNAEFLVGYSRKSYAEQYDYESNVVDLYFDRVAALGRLAISGFIGTGEKVKSVTITATGGMTGKATYPGDFTLGDKNKVNFTKVNEPLVLAYGDGVAAPAEDPFYAYFVAVPGEATVTSIEVLTDQYKYTKTVAEGAKFTFTDEQLLNIVFALSADIAEEVTSESNTWYKASVLEAGQKYLIVSQNQALKNNEGATAAVAVSPVEGIITFESNVDPTIVWTAAARTEMTGTGTDAVVAGNFTLENSGVYLQRKSNNTEQEIVLDAEPSNKKYFVWDYVDNYLKHESSSTVTFFCSYNNGWVAGNTTNGAAPGTDIKTVEIYNNRPPVEISFASAEAKYDLDNKEWTVAIPELTAPEGATVTYSSSNEDIATVATDGTVTPKAAGNVRITATVAGDDKHQGGSAYYELAVTTSKITTWYKAEEIVDGETYLIVSHEYVLENNAGTANAVKVDFSGDVIQYNAPATVLWEAKATSTSGVFTLQNNGQYLYRVSSGSTYGQTSYAPGASSSASSYYQWSYNSETDRISTTGNSTYFVYYSTNNSKWSMSTTEADHPAALYSSNPGLASRNLKFSAESVTHDLANGEDVNEPELSGDSIEGVTYASENEQIATVDANTGAVTLTGKTGSVKITASFLKTDTYKAESVSYTLSVKNSALGPKTYRKVTSASGLEVGAQYLLVYESGSMVFKPILDGTTFKKTTDNAQSVTISSSTITSDQLEDNELTLKEGYYLYVASADRYIYPEGGSGGTSLPAESTPSKQLTITINSDGTAKIASSDIANFTWSSSGYFSSTYQATTTFVVCLYKLDDGTTPTLLPRSLSFPQATYTAQMGTSFTAPELGGVTTGVKYTSSDTGVATVDKDTGTVTLVAAGTTTITASADATDEYAAGSAQYTLTVNAAPGTEKYYVLVTSEPASWNGKYLIVNTAADGSGSAMNGTGTANVTISGGKILSTSTIDGYALTVTSAGEVHPNQTDSNQGLIAYDITFSDGDWLYWYSSKYKQTSEDQSTRHNKCTLFYDNGGVRLMSAGYNVNLSGQPISSTPSKNYLYYQTSGSYTMSSNHASDRVQLYKLDDGGTIPDPGPEPTTPSYTKVTSITSGATYLIVSADAGNYNGADGTKAFTGDQNGTAATVNNAAGVITGDYSAYEFVISASGSDYTLLGPNGYVTGNANSGSRYIQVSSTAGTMSLSMASDFTGTDGQVADAFYFYYSKTSGTSTTKEVLYFNEDGAFKVGGTGRKYGVYLYKKAENP